ncbi:hypothetical protein VTO42DRAFT_6933 [Malbranchea cinnamomea]
MWTKIAAALLGLSVAVDGLQPGAPAPVPAPLRNLSFGQLNFLHTTDTHGWLSGHLQEASYAADWGDYVSFATHMRRIAEDAGTDLLVIDTGDRVEGTGLYDSSNPKGLYTADIIKAQQIDVLSSGNHELYKKRTAEDEYYITVPNFHGNYLASNIDIYEPKSGDRVPLAPRYKKFTTKIQGIRIVAFGFLFDFTGNYNNTVVQPVEETIKEEWFQDAIRDREVDLFLVVGHVPVRSKEYDAIFKAIRSQQWRTPIHFFGGHLHIRDYAKYDDMAYGLASGRFMETIGFASISGLSTGKGEVVPSSLSFSRRYIDNNLWSFYYHTGTNETTFPTAEGQRVSEMITKARHDLKLDHVHGCSPKDLWMSRAKYPSDDSIYTWLGEKVLPEILSRDLREGASGMVIINTGAIRFDMFKGPFTRDSAYLLSPFTGGFRYTKDVPYDKAKELLEVLNHQPQIFNDQPIRKFPSPFLTPPETAGRPQDIIVGDDAASQGPNPDQFPLQTEELSALDFDLIPGYTTKDDAGTDGDDTIHSAISFYRVPNCIQASVSSSSSLDYPEKVDLIYLEFIEPWIDAAAKFVGIDFDIEKDTAEYMPDASLRTVIVDWVKKNWPCKDVE